MTQPSKFDGGDPLQQPGSGMGTQVTIQSLQQQVQELQRQIDELIKSHQHDGLNASLIDLDLHLDGLLETVDTAPTGTPRNLYEQVKIYVNSTTYRLYWYDSEGAVWHYVTATA